VTVSICIPTYNRAVTLAAAVASAQAQTHRDLEILVVDDQSSDGTEAMVREAARADSRVRLVRQKQNVGLARNFSACIAEARGEFIKFLCDDDLLEPDCVAKLMEALSRPGVALAACARKLVDHELRPIRVAAARRRAALIDGETMTRELFAKGNTIGEPTAVLFRRGAAARGFDVRYDQAFDLEMWCHLLRLGAFAFVPAPLCSVRIHSAQATRRNISAGSIIDDKRRLFREMLPRLAGRLSRRERWLWDLRMASSLGRTRAAGAPADAAGISEIFHPRAFRALVPLASMAWSVAR
jgi:glycosyltransferase involved in cell wall biosynthesis